MIILMLVKNSFCSNKMYDIDGIKELSSKYEDVYVVYSIKNLDEKYLSKDILKSDLEELKKSLLVRRKNNNILFLDNISIFLKEIKKTELLNVNLGIIEYEELEDDILILCLLNMEIENINILLDLVEDEWMDRLLRQYEVIKRYNIKKDYFLRNLILDDNKNYWNDNKNLLNVNFNDDFKNSVLDKKTKIILRSEYDLNNLEKIENKDELKEGIESSMIVFRDINVDIEKLYDLLLYLPKMKREMLLGNLLCNPRYCSILFKNSIFWDLIDNKNMLLRNRIFYGYLYLYLCERKLGKYLKKSSNCVLDLEIGRKLPVYDYLLSDYKSSPVISISRLVDVEYCPVENYYGIEGRGNSLVDIESFKRNLNIFMTGKDKNIFSKVNFENIYLTGSMIPCCVIKDHPYMNDYKNGERSYEEVYNDYINEYYNKSDLDVIFCVENVGEFMDRVMKFMNEINGVIEDNIDFEFIRLPILFVNKSFIEENIIPKTDKTYEEIILNWDNEEVRELFRNDMREMLLKSHFKVLGEFKFEDCRIILKNIKNIYYNETIQMKLKSNEIRVIECFPVYNEDPFSSIGKFHYGMVRGCYDGESVKLTLSCVLSLQSNISIGNRLVYGSKDPIELIKKYRKRGFTILLNKKELDKLKESELELEMSPILVEGSIKEEEKLSELNKKIYDYGFIENNRIKKLIKDFI